MPYKLPAQPRQPDSQPVMHTPVVSADTSQQDTNAVATEPDLIDDVNPNKTYSQVWKNEINTPKHCLLDEQQKDFGSVYTYLKTGKGYAES